MSPEEREAFAAEYVMGLLDPAQAEAAERLAATDAGFAEAVEAWRLRLGEIDATAAPQAPDPSLWRRIEAATAAAPRPVRAAPPRPSRLAALWENLAIWRTVGLVASAATIALAVGITLLMGERARTPVLVAVLVGDQNRPSAIVNAFADGRTELVPLEAITAPEGRSLQVWTLWDRARGPVSVGLLDAMRSLELSVQGLPRTTDDQLFEVTLEPAGGSPTGRPTGPILMKGNAARAL